MRSVRQVLVAVATIVTAVVVVAGPASAAPPSNDTQAGAVVLSVPFDYTEKTTEATVDAGEDVARDACLSAGAPAFEHAVWFVATIPDGFGQAVEFDVTGSDYGAGIAVLADFGGGLTALACQPGYYASPGVAPAGTYYVIVFGDGTTAETSGTLHVTADVLPPPPAVDVTINPKGTATKDGGAWVSGTATCTSVGAGGELVDVFGTVQQRVGRAIISSDFDAGVVTPCDGVPHAWSAYAPPTNGRFAGGKAATVTLAIGCDDNGCNSAYLEATIKLSRASK